MFRLGKIKKSPRVKGLGKHPPEKVDVVPYDVVGRYYQVVFFHLVLQPAT